MTQFTEEQFDPGLDASSSRLPALEQGQSINLYESIPPTSIFGAEQGIAFRIRDELFSQPERVIQGSYKPEGSDKEFFITAQPISGDLDQGFVIAQWPLGLGEDDPEGERIKIGFTTTTTRELGSNEVNSKIIPVGQLIKPRDSEKDELEALLVFLGSEFGEFDVVEEADGYGGKNRIKDVSMPRVKKLLDGLSVVMRTEKRKHDAGSSVGKLIKKFRRAS